MIKLFRLLRYAAIFRIVPSILFLGFSSLALSQAPVNDSCINATTLTSSATCVNTAGTLLKATSTSSAGAGCGKNTAADVWYKFTAKTAYPVITLSSIGSNFNSANPRIQLLANTCSPWTQITCVSGTTLDARTSPGGAGLTVGSTYLIRIYSNSSTIPSSGNWGFNICIIDPLPGRIDYSKSYTNISKQSGGGSVSPGDTLEVRATFVVFSNAMDSLAYFDTLRNTKGLKLIPNSLALRTNEGKIYTSFTDATDADAGWRTPILLDTAIQMNLGPNATSTTRGKLRSTSKPSFYNSTCIIMATYRVIVYAGYNTKVNWGGGSITYRDSATGVLNRIAFPYDSLMVYRTVGLCPNSVAATNAIGVESNGTFGTPTNPAPFARNRTSSAYVPNYNYTLFQASPPATVGGPQDYYYGITNNTSAAFTTQQNYGKSDLSSPSYRVFTLWDITGDHTGATNTSKGNPPCDTTKPVSATNPCGYMLVINSSYKADTAFQYTVTTLCPNTHYEISAWFRNMCYKCGCDSNGVGAISAGYIPSATGDSSGVQPDLSFEINGTDYYTTGAINYTSLTTQTGSDTTNTWKKRGFTFRTGASQTSFTLTIRNNAPGGGGNDWAVDDITVATCYPNMIYSPTNNPTVCMNNIITIYDTVRSYFNTYVNYKWQRSTDGGVTWSDIVGASGTGSPVWNGTAYEYVASYTIPIGFTKPSNSGDKYRLLVATTIGNLASAGCSYTDPTTITLTVLTSCGPPLKTDILSVTGKLSGDKAKIFWITSKEDEPVKYSIERSDDGASFQSITIVNGYNNLNTENNSYSYDDPVSVTGKVYYRIVMVSNENIRKYSRTVQLTLTGSMTPGFATVVNPFYNELQYEIVLTAAAPVKVDLVDSYGRLIRSTTQHLNPGVNALSLTNVDGIAPGIYILKAEINDNIFIRKVMKAVN